MTEQTPAPEQPGVPAGVVLDGYARELAAMTRRALTAEAMVATLLAERAQPEPDQAD